MVSGEINLAPEREGGLILRNPLVAGPGTVGYGRELVKLVPLQRLGAIMTTTTTLRPRPLMAQPSVVETPAGVLRATQYANPGLRTVLQRYSIPWQRLGVPIILSLAAEDAETFAYCAELVQREESVQAVVLQPDLLATGEDMVHAVDAVRSVTTLPTIVHVPVGPPEVVAATIEDLAAVGCDAVVVGSPWPGMSVNADTRKPDVIGGVWGPAVRPLALCLLYDVAQLLGPQHMPLIGAGGVSSFTDVAAFLAVGASAVLLDTVLWVNPAALTNDSPRGFGDL